MMGKRHKHPIPDELAEPIVVTDVLDLHGFYPEEIREIVTDFIENAVILNLKQVRIIHGKGRSRLKWEVHQVLDTLPQVAQYGDAGGGSGGWGATRITLC